jgi:VanZ family protein
MKRIVYFLPAAVYYFLIFLLSSSNFAIPINVHHFDKAAHLAEFAVLGFLLALGFFNIVTASVAVKFLLTFLASVSLAGLDEFHQYFVPGREVEILDALADALGAACGALVYWRLFWRKRRAAKP